MSWQKGFLKTPFLLMFVILVGLGVGTASALITITLSGDVVIDGTLDMTGDKITNVGNPTTATDAATKGYVDSSPTTDTLASLGCSSNQVAHFDGTIWSCKIIKGKLNPVFSIGDDVSNYAFSDMAIGTDGNPVISHYNLGPGDLNIIKCGNPTCSSGNTITTVDSIGDVGEDSSIAIGSDGKPVVSYYDQTNFSLKILKCGNSSCSAGNLTTTVDGAGNVGFYSSIAIGSDGNPVISYWDILNSSLKILKCGNISCSAGNIITTVNTGDEVAHYSSIAIGTDTNPVISYFDNGNSDLRIAKCGNTSCSSGNSFSTIDSTGNLGEHSSIAIGSDGNPFISYYDKTNQDLKIAKCGNTSCSSGNTIITLDSNGNVGFSSSIAIGSDGNPVIGYEDLSNNDLKFIKCGDLTCSQKTITTLDSDGLVGGHPSIFIGLSDNPVISYDGTNGDVNVVTEGIALIYE